MKSIHISRNNEQTTFHKSGELLGFNTVGLNFIDKRIEFITWVRQVGRKFERDGLGWYGNEATCHWLFESCI